MIKKLLLSFFAVNMTFAALFAQNCPTYSNNVTSAFFTCANQDYFFEVANATYPGTISFQVSGSYGFLGGGTWQITSNLTGNVIASGTANVITGGTFNTNVGPINPQIQGSVFTFTAGTTSNFTSIQVTQSGTTIASSGGGVGISFIFQPNINISAATLTITTPTGNVTNTVQNCRNFKVPINLLSNNFCTTIQVNLPWTITCNITGAVLSSGVHPMTLFPRTPSNANDVVNIEWNTNSCQWNVTGANDCNLTHIGSVFSISPDPFALNTNACSVSSQSFTINYSGIPNGPDCCSTAGPLVPIVQNVSVTKPDAQVRNSPFGGTNNSAYQVIPANGGGGQATSVNLNVSMTGYCFDPPGTGTNTSYWVTVYVDGVIIHDVQYNTGNSVNLNFTLTNIPGGFDESSIVEVYIYPNAFNMGTVNTTYNPNANCSALSDGHWTVSTFNVTLTANFTEQQPTPISCSYLLSNVPIACCTPTPAANVTENACNNSTGSLNTWRTNIEQSNTTCLVFSSVTPVAGSVLPNNQFPNGNNTTCQPITQTVSAYAYCDTDGSGTINTGDTYTLLSTFTLTVNPSAPTLITENGACDVPPTAELLCNGNVILSETGLAPVQSCGNGVNTTNISGTFTASQIAVALGNANATCYSNVNYSATASCAQTPIEDGVFNFTTVYCEGSDVDLLPATSVNGISGTWTPSEINNTASQSYLFTPNNTDCSNPVTVSVEIVPAPDAGLDGDLTVCAGTEITVQSLFSSLNGSPDAGGTWSPSVSGLGTYIYTVAGNAPCADASAQVVVEEYPLAEVLVEANPDTVIFLDSSTLTVTGGESYVWSPVESNEASLTVAPTQTTTYTVQVTDEFGCVQEFSVTVFVNIINVAIALPDAFTPNNDGNNDVFEVHNKQDFAKIEMRVYDRWNNIVHEGFDQNHGWDGTYKNKPLNSGMYVYYVFAETLAGQQIKVTSNVSLIR